LPSGPMDNIPSSMTGPTGRKPPLSAFVIGGLLVVVGACLLPSSKLIALGGALIVIGIVVCIVAVRRTAAREPPNSGAGPTQGNE
jgi:hypothetical protein